MAPFRFRPVQSISILVFIGQIFLSLLCHRNLNKECRNGILVTNPTRGFEDVSSKQSARLFRVTECPQGLAKDEAQSGSL
jgi:hypothetical protein